MKLSKKVSFGAMYYYLDNYYFIDEKDDIGALCGEINLLDDGTPADSAAMDDWLRGLKKIIGSRHEFNLSLSEKEAYMLMIYFLEDYYLRLQYKDIKILLDELSVDKNGIPINFSVWSDWQVAVNKALEDERLIAQ